MYIFHNMLDESSVIIFIDYDSSRQYIIINCQAKWTFQMLIMEWNCTLIQISKKNLYKKICNIVFHIFSLSLCLILYEPTQFFYKKNIDKLKNENLSISQVASHMSCYTSISSADDMLQSQRMTISDIIEPT